MNQMKIIYIRRDTSFQWIYPGMLKKQLLKRHKALQSEKIPAKRTFCR